MRDSEGINWRVGWPMLGAATVAAGAPLVYFMSGEPALSPKIVLLALTILGFAVAILAAGLMFITRSLQQRIARLEERDRDTGPRGTA